MQRKSTRFPISRRRFGFWVGMGLFSLAERLGAEPLDSLAAAILSEEKSVDPRDDSPIPEHWTTAENNTWHWFVRENWAAGQWQLTGITTPVHKTTGERFSGATGYLDDSLVPLDIRRSRRPEVELSEDVRERLDDDISRDKPGEAIETRRARHGRPPSKWIRSLGAEELRIWLKTIEIPEAGVSGMSFWEHLTRDHAFDPEKIEGLTIDEQAKLHAAAHFGY